VYTLLKSIEKYALIALLLKKWEERPAYVMACIVVCEKLIIDTLAIENKHPAQCPAFEQIP